MSVVPTTLEQALATTGATYIGGGTDLMPLLKNRVRADRQLVFLHRLPQLKGIQAQGEYLYVGAGETLFDLASSEAVKNAVPAIAQACAATASPQIRNIATLGGNIMQDRRCIYFNQSHSWRSGLPLCFKTGGTVCHQMPNAPVCKAIYYSDVATALVLYEAQVEYVEQGRTQWSAVEELIARHAQANGLGCGEHLPLLILRVRVPIPPAGERSGFYKYAMRATIDFPLINFALRCGGGREAKVVAGAVSHQPVVLSETAALLERDVDNEAVVTACALELNKRATPIREACITPRLKRTLYQQVEQLLHLRQI